MVWNIQMEGVTIQVNGETSKLAAFHKQYAMEISQQVLHDLFGQYTNLQQ